MTEPKKPVLEPAAQAFAKATATPPFNYQIPVADGRKALEDLQSGDELKPDAKSDDVVVDLGSWGHASVRIVKPPSASGPLPVLLYVHGAGWVFGSPDTHDRLVRELAVGAGVAVVVPHYDRSPEAKYPTALEQCWSVAEWILVHGSEHGLDSTRLMVGGDSVGGNMTAALTLLAKQRGGVAFRGQLLFYPVTDASFDTDSYHQFAEGPYLRRDGMKWFFDQYTTDPGQRAEITVSPLRATSEQLADLPPALVITGEADVLRDEGEAYADHLRAAGVAVTAFRCAGIIHDFVMLDTLRSTFAAEAAITAATGFVRSCLTGG